MQVTTQIPRANQIFRTVSNSSANRLALKHIYRELLAVLGDEDEPLPIFEKRWKEIDIRHACYDLLKPLEEFCYAPKIINITGEEIEHNDMSLSEIQCHVLEELCKLLFYGEIEHPRKTTDPRHLNRQIDIQAILEILILQLEETEEECGCLNLTLVPSIGEQISMNLENTRSESLRSTEQLAFDYAVSDLQAKVTDAGFESKYDPNWGIELKHTSAHITFCFIEVLNYADDELIWNPEENRSPIDQLKADTESDHLDVIHILELLTKQGFSFSEAELSYPADGDYEVLRAYHIPMKPLNEAIKSMLLTVNKGIKKFSHQLSCRRRFFKVRKRLSRHSNNN